MTFKRLDNLYPALMLITAVWSLGGGIHRWWFACLISLVLLMHVVWGLRLPGPARSFWAILLTVPFALWMRYGPRESLTGFVPIDWLFVIGMYGTALGSYLLLAGRSTTDRHQALATAIFAYALSGTVAVGRNAMFMPLLVPFVVFLLLALRWELGLTRWPLKGSALLRYGIAAAATVALAWVIQTFVLANLSSFDSWLGHHLFSADGGAGGLGFSRQVHLGTLDAFRHEGRMREVMIRQWSDRPIEYLRGAAFDRYDRGTWTAMNDTQEVRAANEADRGRNVFVLASGGVQPPEAIVYPAAGLADTFFLPLGTARISAFGDRIVMNPQALSASSPQRRSAGGYILGRPTATLPPPGPDDLQVPPVLHAELRRIALSAMRESASPRQDLAELETWFRQHYQYRLGVHSAGRDPVLGFLETTHAGHCEYFASAAVLLLRSMGIPARYVTGFVCREREMGGLWIARREDAHAWVEVFVSAGGRETPPDPPAQGARGKGHPREGASGPASVPLARLPATGQDGSFSSASPLSLAPGLSLPTVGTWVTFDPTPPAGQPPARQASTWDRFGALIAGWFDRLRGILVYGGLFTLLMILWESFAQAVLSVPVYIWLLAVLVGMGWLFRGRLRRLVGHRRTTPATPQTRRLQGLLRQAERLAARHGVVRAPGETVGTFLDHVDVAPIPDAIRARLHDLLNQYRAGRFRP